MADVDKELKPLLPKQRQFIDNIVFKGMTREEAYCDAYGKDISTGNPESIRANASKLFYTPHVNNYYHAVMEEIRDNDIKKAIWTKDVATEKLMKLAEKAESEIYDENKPITMSRLQAVMQPIKELNQMNGFNQTNLSVEGQIVQICGEDDIPD